MPRPPGFRGLVELMACEGPRDEDVALERCIEGDPALPQYRLVRAAHLSEGLRIEQAIILEHRLFCGNCRGPRGLATHADTGKELPGRAALYSCLRNASEIESLLSSPVLIEAVGVNVLINRIGVVAAVVEEENCGEDVFGE